MTKHVTIFDNGFARLYKADARHLPIPDSSVDCVVTSPPYWGLRDYGIEGHSWGGDPECEHTWATVMPAGYRSSDTNPGPLQSQGTKNREALVSQSCAVCGAWLGTLGLEPTPEAYCANMVEVFREVWRVLKPTGTVWMNLGDSYAGGNYRGGGVGNASAKQKSNTASQDFMAREAPIIPSGLKPKDLVGIPWRVAFALQADGWYLRSDIIWSKPNPMPESVTDRPTKAHEYVFLLTKSPRYYYDADAIREPHQDVTLQRITYGLKHKHPNNIGVGIPPVDTDRMGERFAHAGGRNKRSVWEIATQPYPEAHFATYPEKLVEPCIMAGCPQDGVVLDPFAGSGTTLAVAQRLGRKCIGTDLSEEYLKLASKRLGAIAMPMILV